MRKLILLLFGLFSSGTLLGAVAFNSKVDIAGTEITGTNTFTKTANLTVGTNGILVVDLGAYDDTTTLDVSTITWNTVGMTKVATKNDTNPDHMMVTMWVLANPASGSHNLVVTFNHTATIVYSGALLTYDGVDQGTIFRTPTSSINTFSPITTTYTNGQTNDVIIDAWSAAEPSAWSVGGGHAVRYHDSNNTFQPSGGSEAAGSASVVMSWTGPAREWVQVVTGLIPASGSTATPTRNRFHVAEFVRTPTPAQIVSTRWKD